MKITEIDVKCHKTKMKLNLQNITGKNISLRKTKTKKKPHQEVDNVGLQYLKNALQYGVVKHLPGPKAHSTLIFDKYLVIDVKGDGNCGYYAIMKGLIKLGKLVLTPGYTASTFRKDIYLYGVQNFDKLKVIESYRFMLEKAKDPNEWWNSTLLKVIHDGQTNYDEGCSFGKWYKSSISPIICDMFDINIRIYQVPNPNTQIYYKANNNIFTKIFWKAIHTSEIENINVDEYPTIAIINSNGCHYHYLSKI